VTGNTGASNYRQVTKENLYPCQNKSLLFSAFRLPNSI
jgi:hypothetical protein